MRRLVWFYVCALVLGACGSVPDLHFVNDDAGSTSRSDASTSPKDGGSTPDTGASDECGDQGIPAPASDAVCCGGVWCSGNCGEANCGLCAQRCDPGQGQVCCGKGGNVNCKDRCP